MLYNWEFCGNLPKGSWHAKIAKLSWFQHINQTPYAYIEKVHDSTILFDFVESGAYQSFIDVIDNVAGGRGIAKKKTGFLQGVSVANGKP